MATLEELRARIRTIDDLHGVVRTMKALAQVGNRRYQAVRASLEDYAANVDLALQALLQVRRFRAWSPPLPSERRSSGGGGEVGLILFGTDHGLCGTFNERVLDCTRAHCREHGIAAERRHLAVVGARLDSLLEGEGWPVEERYRVPTSLEGASRLVQDLLLLVERWHFRGGLGDGSSDDATAVAAPLVGRVLLVLQRARSPASCEPTAWPLLPLDPGWFQAAGARPWRSVSRPLLLEPEFSLFAAILREQLHVILFRAVVESLASENGARLRAMHSAQQHIEERLDELHAGFRKQRQDAITAELLDIVAGFEALGQDS